MIPATSAHPWPHDWRQAAWAALKSPWDMIVIGGGVTGAGILALAAGMGLRVLLLEQDDFAAGASSRSSKLVHGGLRYLKHMQLKLTRASVQERQHLLQAAPGLVAPLNFIYPVFEGDKPGAWLLEFGLGVYTHLAADTGGYRELTPVDMLMLAPGLRQRDLQNGYLYADAQTDDARLVLRLLHDALAANPGRAVALNYARVTGLLRAGDKVAGVQVRDQTTGAEHEALAGVVINATGAWADRLRRQTGAAARLRPLRGSHLFFSPGRFPVYQAIAMLHPDDGRPVFAYPWEGVTLLGTTDVDHKADLADEPSISTAETAYLLRVAQHHFPDLGLSRKDVISTQAGIRPVVDSGKADPSAEARDHVTWLEDGLLTVTGGKLTTFRLLAVDALRAAHEANPALPRPDARLSLLAPLPTTQPLPGVERRLATRMWGRYGAAAPQMAGETGETWAAIPGTPYHWAELAWSAQNEAIVHLDDLLLRRFRLGILLPDGGHSLLARLRPHLDWGNEHWAVEVERYLQIWQRAHGLPDD